MGPSWRGSKTTLFLGGSPLGPFADSLSAIASAACRLDILIQLTERVKLKKNIRNHLVIAAHSLNWKKTSELFCDYSHSIDQTGKIEAKIENISTIYCVIAFPFRPSNDNCFSNISSVLNC